MLVADVSNFKSIKVKGWLKEKGVNTFRGAIKMLSVQAIKKLYSCN